MCTSLLIPSIYTGDTDGMSVKYLFNTQVIRSRHAQGIPVCRMCSVQCAVQCNSLLLSRQYTGNTYVITVRYSHETRVILRRSCYAGTARPDEPQKASDLARSARQALKGPPPSSPSSHTGTFLRFTSSAVRVTCQVIWHALSM